MDFFKTLIGILQSPVETYRELKKSRPSLTYPTIIILLIGIVSLNIISVVLSFVGWIVNVGILFVVSKMLRGKSGFKRLLEFLGYSELPILLSTFIALGLSFISELIADLIIAIGGIWAIVLGVLAVREANEFSTLRAVIVVFIPIIIGVVLAAIIVTFIYTQMTLPGL